MELGQERRFSRASRRRFTSRLFSILNTIRDANVEAQQRNPHSLLWWTKRVLALRQRWKAFAKAQSNFSSLKIAKSWRLFDSTSGSVFWWWPISLGFPNLFRSI